MSSHASTSPRSKKKEETLRPSRWRWLTQGAFILSLALVACRALMSESIRDSLDALSATQTGGSMVQAPRNAGPADGLVLDLFFCLPMLLVLARRSLDPSYRLLTSRAAIPMTLLGLLAALSPLWSEDRFAAVVSAAHLVAAMVFLFSTLQLLRSWLRLRIVGGVCIGILMSLALVGYDFRADMADLKKTYDHDRDAILLQHHWQLGSVEAHMFEARVRNGEPMGYSLSPNTYAALLVMLGIISAGIALQHIADRDHWGWYIVPALAALATVPLVHYTQCRAAYATPGIAAAILALVGLLRKQLRRSWRRGYALGVIGFFAGVAIVVLHGIRTGNLWHDSLNFRLLYWTGAYRALIAGLYHSPRQFFVFLFGVGWENFGPAYLAHRLQTASEEIRDPHNFLVRAFVELGIVGGLLLIAWMLRLWWELIRPATPASDEKAIAYGQREAIFTFGAIVMLGIGLNILESIDFSSIAADYELIRRLYFLAFIVAGMIAAAIRRTPDHALDSRSGQIHIELDPRPAPWILYTILAALGTFLIHNLIEFSLFEPGPLFLFALLTGSALGMRAEGLRAESPEASDSMNRPAAAGWIAALAALTWFIAGVGIVAPIASAESIAHDADDEIAAAAGLHDPRLLEDAAQKLKSAWQRVPYNADYARRAAEVLIVDGGDTKERAKTGEMLNAAVAADPSSAQNLIMRAQFELRSGETDAALRDYRFAATLDPRNVRLRLDFARELLAAARAQHRPHLAADAALQYERALDGNAQFDQHEIKRLSAAELADAQRGLAEATQLAR